MERFGALLRRVPLHDAGDRGHAEGGDEPTQCRQNPAAPPQGLSVGATVFGGGPSVGLAEVEDRDHEVGSVAEAVETVPIEATGGVVGPREGGVWVAAGAGGGDAIRRFGLQPAGRSEDNIGVGGEGAFGPCEVGEEGAVRKRAMVIAYETLSSMRKHVTANTTGRLRCGRRSCWRSRKPGRWKFRRRCSSRR